jgi:hypothetical protein
LISSSLGLCELLEKEQREWAKLAMVVYESFGHSRDVLGQEVCDPQAFGILYFTASRAALRMRTFMTMEG